MYRPAPRMPRPGHRAFGQQDADLGIGTGLALDQRDRDGAAVRCQPAGILDGIGDCRRKADAAKPRRNLLKPRERETEEVAIQIGSARLRGVSVPLDTDVGHAFITDCCRYTEGLLSDSEIKGRWALKRVAI